MININKKLNKLIEKCKLGVKLNYKKDVKIKYMIVLTELQKAKKNIEDQWNDLEEN